MPDRPSSSVRSDLTLSMPPVSEQPPDFQFANTLFYSAVGLGITVGNLVPLVIWLRGVCGLATCFTMIVVTQRWGRQIAAVVAAIGLFQPSLSRRWKIFLFVSTFVDASVIGYVAAGQHASFIGVPGNLSVEFIAAGVVAVNLFMFVTVLLQFKWVIHSLSDWGMLGLLGPVVFAFIGGAVVHHFTGWTADFLESSFVLGAGSAVLLWAGILEDFSPTLIPQA